VSSDVVTCEWTQHPAQRHRALRPSCDGGPITLRRRYRVAYPQPLHADRRLVTHDQAR
jgi:hypothetical protein